MKSFEYALWLAPSSLLRNKVSDGIRKNLVSQNISYSDLVPKSEEAEEEVNGGETQNGVEVDASQNQASLQVDDATTVADARWTLNWLIMFGVVGVVVVGFKRRQFLVGK